MPPEMILPPNVLNQEGLPRRVGVEIEFGRVSCERASELVRDLFSGSIEAVDPYRFHVRKTVFGDFEIELDSQYAHIEQSEYSRENAGPVERKTLKDEVKEGVTTAFAEVASFWLPVEIVSPPVPLHRLPELDAISAALRAAGAEGTNDALFYAFATQLNPEAPSLEAPFLLRHLKAFLLLAKSLRARIDVDPVRRALPFAQPFPTSYAVQVVGPKYQPDMRQMIADYIGANPTRNRELDMLPLFAHVAPEILSGLLEDGRIKARPAFHYRLPDTKLSDFDWGLIIEWNRWVEVEQLAADETALERLGHAFINAAARHAPAAFAEALEDWRVEKAAAH